MKFSFLSKYFLMLLVISATAMMAMGQAGVSSVNGNVTDANGQVVVGANVTLVSAGQGGRRSVVTSSDGRYNFSSVQPGKYTVEVEAQGFKKSVTTEIDALVDKATEIAIVVEVGDVSAIVTVEAGGIESIVNKSDASLGNNFVEKQISQLPLEGRNVAALLSLQPGVTPDGAVAGGRQDQANITLDGVDVNDQQTGLNLDQTEAFASVLRVTPDSIGEFRVTTTNPDASKGRSAGAQVSLITKSGSNEFRGSLYEYHRNTVTTANDWFNNATGTPRPKLIRNLFGGSIGGPILKDKLFFFYNYEGMREAKDVGVVSAFPLASLAAGNISFTDELRDPDGLPVAGYTPVRRTINLAQLNALMSGAQAVVDMNPFVMQLFAQVSSRYTNNDPTSGDGFNVGAMRFNSPLPVKLNTHTARFDWAVTEDQKHQVSVRGNYQDDLFARASLFPDTPSGDRWSHPTGLNAAHTWLISNNLTNRFSYGLSRVSTSLQGDSAVNAITFRDIYAPNLFTRTQSRVNPTHNITNDMTWIKGDHTFQFGTNIRMTRNKRTNLASAYDNGTTNFGFYPGSGNSLLTPLDQWLNATFPTGDPTRTRHVNGAASRTAQSSLAALIGRLNQYTANFIYDINGTPVNGQPTVREWATEEYDFYVQDSWKLRQSLTLNLGLRYGLSKPVYETQGFQVAPNIALDEYFARRQAAAFNGQNYDEPLILDKAGPKNGKPGFYEWDKNNWQPRLSAAWSPNFKDGFLSKVFGKNRASVLRGGFAMTNDYFGQQLAVQFDAANTLGYVSRYTTPANTFNITTNPAPLLTSLGQNIRNLPGVAVPGNLTFPLQHPQDLRTRIESSLDRGLKAPVNYSWNLTYGRELPFKMYVETSYVARLARDLLATRDVMTPNNIRDGATGQTWYDAATALEIHRRNGTSLANLPNLPYFNNIYGAGHIADSFFGPGSGLTNSQAIYLVATDPEVAGFAGTDWTYIQLLLDQYTSKQLFYQSQYGALDSFGTIANSDYHAGTLSLRQRLSGLTWDFNYTYSKSMDDTSGLQNSGAFGGAFILNPLRQRDNYGFSDFDMRHIVNFNSVWDIPIGRGQKFFSNLHPVVNALVGGWRMSNIIRYNSGEPIGTGNKYFDNSGWPTNWNLKSAVIQTAPIQTGVFYGPDGDAPYMFSDPLAAYKSFRSPYPGETGDRNKIRFPAFYVWDMGLQKSFKMPWAENHNVSFRWDVFNVTNTPIFSGIGNTALGYMPNQGIEAPDGFGQYTFTKSAPRVMQFAIRYDF